MVEYSADEQLLVHHVPPNYTFPALDEQPEEPMSAAYAALGMPPDASQCLEASDDTPSYSEATLPGDFGVEGDPALDEQKEAMEGRGPGFVGRPEVHTAWHQLFGKVHPAASKQGLEAPISTGCHHCGDKDYENEPKEVCPECEFGLFCKSKNCSTSHAAEHRRVCHLLKQARGVGATYVVCTPVALPDKVTRSINCLTEMAAAGNQLAALASLLALLAAHHRDMGADGEKPVPFCVLSCPKSDEPCLLTIRVEKESCVGCNAVFANPNKCGVCHTQMVCSKKPQCRRLKESLLVQSSRKFKDCAAPVQALRFAQQFGLHVYLCHVKV